VRPAPTRRRHPSRSVELQRGATWHSVGSHELKDFPEPPELFQLAHPELPFAFPPRRTLSPRRHNLPWQHTSIVGWVRDLDAVQRAVTGAINRALGLTDVPGRSQSDALVDRLTVGPTLLLLDNFEQLGGAGGVIARLMAAAPFLTVPGRAESEPVWRRRSRQGTAARRDIYCAGAEFGADCVAVWRARADVGLPGSTCGWRCRPSFGSQRSGRPGVYAAGHSHARHCRDDHVSAP
jgi:hypothetical protein